jgi:NAD(P)-dependent dehydrogenase (short-subunit alcohol dehydrogenase family)
MSRRDGEGRVALVTGANRGIGLEVARELAARGMTVLLGCRDVEKGREAARRLGPRVHGVALEVTEGASVAALVEAVEREHGRLDVLVNNAGVYLDEGVRGLDVDMETVGVTLETNTVGPLRLIQAFAPMMKRRGYGRIVNVTSGYGAMRAMDSGGVLAYKLSKLALNGMTRVLAAELRGTGVLVNVVDPGWVRTDMGGPGAPRSVEQGADTLVWLATLPDDGPTGGFFHDRKPVPW